MNDVELARALERGEVASENFRHTCHLHVAWVYLSESTSIDDASGKMRETLRRFAARAGTPEKYHQTITLFWIRLLGCLRITASGKTLEEIVDSNPQLLEKNFPLTYYSRGRLFSDRARMSWVEPDLKSLPIDASALYSSSSQGNPSDRALSR